MGHEIICSKQQFFLLMESNDYHLGLKEISKTHVPLHRRQTTYLQKLKYILSANPLLKAPPFKESMYAILLYSCKRTERKVYYSFPNGDCVPCHYGHTISTLNETIQEFSTFHPHPWKLMVLGRGIFPPLLLLSSCV